MSKEATTNYGSIEEGDAAFDATKMQYLGKGKPLTREEKIRKMIRVGVPLLISALIVFAAYFFLTKDFQHLYPGHGGEKVSTVEVSTTKSSTSKHSSLPSSKIDSTCSAHEACLALQGNCCPTNGGIFLDCCN